MEGTEWAKLLANTPSYMNRESERGRLFKILPDPMLERKCSWKFKIQFLVPKKSKIKMKEQTLNSLSKRGPSYQHYQKKKKKKK